MAVYRRPARSRFVLLVVALASVTLLTVDERSNGGGAVDGVRDAARDAFAPVSRTAAAVARPVGNFFEGAFRYGDVEAENARLRAELAEREGQVLRAADAERERTALIDQANLSSVGDIPTVAARVVSALASNFALTVEIDRGGDHGVIRGMPVVSGAGLVGRVVDASRTRATVLLLTDSTSNVGVRLTGSGDAGVAVGRGRGSSLRVDLVDPATKVAAGEAVVTSGLQDSLFPPGIPMGRVKAATAAPGAVQQDVTVEPVVDVRRLAFVKVLLWSPTP